MTEIEKWITITLKASFLALENHKSEQHSQEIIAASFNEVANKLDPDSKKVFIENLPKGLTLNSEDACWMMKTLMLTVPSLDGIPSISFASKFNWILEGILHLELKKVRIANYLMDDPRLSNATIYEIYLLHL